MTTELEIEDFDPNTGHKHKCPWFDNPMSNCVCAAELYSMLHNEQEKARKIRENTGQVWLNALNCIRPNEEFIQKVGADIITSIRGAKNPEKEFEPFAATWAIRVVAS